MPVYDDFDNKRSGQTSGMFGRGSKAKPIVLGIILLIAVFALTETILAFRNSGAGDDRPVPVIKADTTPIKAAPEQPGGMDIPYRESTVFDTLQDGKEPAKVENLLPEAEKPIDKSAVFPEAAKVAPPEATSPAASVSTVAATPAAANAPVPLTAASVNPSPTPSQAQAPTLPATLAVAATVPPTPATVKAPAVEVAPIASVAAIPAKTIEKDIVATQKAAVAAVATAHDTAIHHAPTAKGSRYIQLASVKDHAAAENAWKMLQKQFPAELSSSDMRIQEATVKGVPYYRVQVAVAGDDQAKSACARINAKRPGGCIVVH